MTLSLAYTVIIKILIVFCFCFLKFNSLFLLQACPLSTCTTARQRVTPGTHPPPPPPPSTPSTTTTTPPGARTPSRTLSPWSARRAAGVLPVPAVRPKCPAAVIMHRRQCTHRHRQCRGRYRCSEPAAAKWWGGRRAAVVAHRRWPGRRANNNTGIITWAAVTAI